MTSPTYTREEKEGSLRDLELYFEDSPATSSKVSLTEDEALYPEIKAKNNLIKSKTINGAQVGTRVYFSIFLHIDFFLTDKYLPHDIDITIRLIRSDKRFGILAPPADANANPAIPQPDYVSKIHDLQLSLRSILTSREYRHTLNKTLLHPLNRPKFQYNDTKIGTFILPEGIGSYVIPNLDSGLLPRQIVIGFVRTLGFAGSYHHNPFLFESFDLKSIYALYGSQTIPSQALKIDFQNKDTARAYRFTLDNIGVGIGHTNLGFTRRHFEEGKSLFCFDFSANLNSGSQLSEPKHGLINLYLEFAKPLPTVVQCICHYNFDGGFFIDESKSVVQISI